jgi:hypothetical protein
MRAPFEVRLGAISGWIALVGVIVGFIAIPVAIAGQPPTVSSDPATVIAYFRHPEFALIDGVAGVFFGVVAIVPFAYGLRSVLRAGGQDRARVFADLGLALVVVTAPVYLVSSALGAMLVQAANGDPTTFATLFRLYDVMYDGGADVLEGAWIGAFSLAALWAVTAPIPRWVAWIGIAVGLSRWIKAFIPVAPVPEAVIPLSGLLFVVWFIAIVVVVTRAAMHGRANSVPAIAPAG